MKDRMQVKGRLYKLTLYAYDEKTGQEGLKPETRPGGSRKRPKGKPKRRGR
ncbi:MAG: hypothetical protein Q4B15_08210 [Lachnospiraceae bacterium]|nr:hypothetical protein [Lachnospiraceae bacterium]